MGDVVYRTVDDLVRAPVTPKCPNCGHPQHPRVCFWCPCGVESPVAFVAPAPGVVKAVRRTVAALLTPDDDEAVRRG